MSVARTTVGFGGTGCSRMPPFDLREISKAQELLTAVAGFGWYEAKIAKTVRGRAIADPGIGSLLWWRR